MVSRPASKNSSIPPSKDENKPKRTQAQRTKSNRKSGGQNGHEGKKLEMVDNPTHIVTNNIDCCDNCSAQLPIQADQYDAKQVFDLPLMDIEVTEHMVAIKKCTNCGKKNKASFPEGIVQKAQYGEAIKGWTVYLQNYQMLPFAGSTGFHMGIDLNLH